MRNNKEIVELKSEDDKEIVELSREEIEEVSGGRRAVLGIARPIDTVPLPE